MEIIENLSYKVSRSICYPIDRKNDVEIIKYGVEIMMKSAIKIISLLAIGLLLGNLGLLLCATGAFIVFRLLAGGFHFKTYLSCYTFSVGLLTGLTLIAEALPKLLVDWKVLLLTATLSLAILLIFKPLINADRPYAENQSLYLALSVFFIILCVPITLGLLEMHPKYAIAIQLAILAQSMTLIRLKKGGN